MAPLTAILQTMDYLNIFFAHYYPSRTLYTAYNTCNLVALVLLFKWGDKIWPNKRCRMITGYSLYTVILMMLPLVSTLETSWGVDENLQMILQVEVEDIEMLGWETAGIRCYSLYTVILMMLPLVGIDSSGF